jgi:hypothetical protein
MDHELIAHLNKLSSAEMTVEAERVRENDIITDLEIALEDAGGFAGIVIRRAIGEIHRLRNRVDDLSALAHISRNSP